MAFRVAALLVSLAAAGRVSLAAAGPVSAAAGGPAPASASPGESPYLAELVARARAGHLAQDPAWIRLGHWRPRLLGGLKSEVDGKEFFLAPGGKLDPSAELEATLAAFFDPAPHAEELDAARCRFPARLLFLTRRLGLDPAVLPPRSCPKLDAYLERVRPRGVTFVFSSYYLNNPASAFGHTLLRLDKSGQARAGKDAELLDYGVDFAATVTTSNAILYAFQGLFGLFRGEFKYYAYYYKVRQYGDYESRDLFEYELALDEDEVAMLAAHVWELGGTWFRYWYLDENCSYHVLAALEAAAPRLDLVSHVGRAVVLPSDTVQALFANPGLVRAVHRRPSIRVQFEARARGLRSGEASLVEALERDPAAALPAGLGDERRAAVLDAAVDLLDLRHARGLLLGNDQEAATRRQALLGRRAAVPVTSPELTIPNPAERRPEAGHRSLRLGGGGGASRTGGGFASLDLRLALHDLADPPDGYPPNAQLEFLPTRLRWYPRERRLELDDVSLAKVLSVNPLGRFDLRPSWRARFGATTVRDAGCHRCLAGIAEVGTGPAVTGLLGAVDLLAFGDAELLGAPGLDGIRGAGVRLGLGPSGLVRLRAGTYATLLGEARWRWFPESEPRSAWSLSATLRLHAGRNLSLGLEARRTAADDELSAVLLGYF